jgi:hypothetical protein
VAQEHTEIDALITQIIRVAHDRIDTKAHIMAPYFIAGFPPKMMLSMIFLAASAH